MPGQALRQKKIRLKLNTVRSEFKDKVVLLVDDSIVRGSTSVELVKMARDAGAKKVYFASAAPPVRFPNFYGIDIPTCNELVAYERAEEGVAEAIGADRVFYNDLEDLEESIRNLNPKLLQAFDSSCFSGKYVTPEVTPQYVALSESRRGLGRTGATELSASTKCSPGESRSDPHGGDSIENHAHPTKKLRMISSSPCESLHNHTG